MRRIEKAKSSYYRDVVSIYALSYEDVPEALRPSEIQRQETLDRINEDIDNGGLFLLISDYRPLAYAVVSDDLVGTFFPKSHSFSSASALADKMGQEEERLCVLRDIHVPVTSKRKGIAYDLLQSILGRYPHTSWILWVNENNVPALRLFEKCGFSSLGVQDIEQEGRSIVLYKKYRPSGLCREARW